MDLFLSYGFWYVGGLPTLCFNHVGFLLSQYKRTELQRKKIIRKFILYVYLLDMIH